MRLWSVHPEYLDAKGLVALWREALLARKVLCGKTKGYKNHPQLLRFRASSDPVKSIDCYLQEVYRESVRRGYLFDAEKINWEKCEEKIPVTSGQLEYEKNHLLEKLEKRSEEQHKKLKNISVFKAHPFFHVIEGKVEKWEKT